MRTASEMYQYCIDNEFGGGFNASWGEKHFGIIEGNLQSDEDVLMTFIGLHNYISMTKHEGNCAYAITNKRLIIAQKKMIGEFVKIVLLQNLNDVTLKSSMVLGGITFDTIKETFNVSLDKAQAKNIFAKVQNVLFEAKEKNNDTASSPKVNLVEELKGLKQLLDDGILTLAEFDAEKAKILDR